MRAVSLEKKASEDLWLLDSFSSSPLSSPCNLKSSPKGWGKNVIVMYTCKDNLTPLLYSGKIKKTIIKKNKIKSFSFSYLHSQNPHLHLVYQSPHLLLINLSFFPVHHFLLKASGYYYKPSWVCTYKFKAFTFRWGLGYHRSHSKLLWP